MTPINKWSIKGAWRWFKSGVRALWPFADAALELAKPLIVNAYDKLVDAQQAELVKNLRVSGPLKVSKLYDRSQAKIIKTIQNINLAPQKWRDAACSIIEDEGNRFQRQLIQTLQDKGPDGLNKLIDAIQANIRGRIKAL